MVNSTIDLMEQHKAHSCTLFTQLLKYFPIMCQIDHISGLSVVLEANLIFDTRTQSHVVRKHIFKVYCCLNCTPTFHTVHINHTHFQSKLKKSTISHKRKKVSVHEGKLLNYEIWLLHFKMTLLWWLTYSFPNIHVAESRLLKFGQNVTLVVMHALVPSFSSFDVASLYSTSLS